MASSVAAACSSKLNERQKRLRSARPQARLMRLPKGEWMTSCMPPASSKKRSKTIVSLRGQRPERGARGGQVARPAARAAGAGDARRRCRRASAIGRLESAVEPRLDLARAAARRSATAHRVRPGASPSQNGCRRLPVRVLDAHPSRLDAQDAVGDVAELEDVALQALDGEVLVHRADELRLRLEDHLVVGGVGDRAAGGERGEARAAPALDDAVDGVVVHERAVAAAARAVAFGEHAARARRTRRACRSRYGQARAHQREQLVLVPLARRDFGHDLLRQHVEGLAGHAQPVELAAPHRSEQRRALDQVVARQREQPPLGRAAERVAGAADALQEGRDRARRAELAHQVDLADVDAELERGGGDQRAQLAALQALLGVEARLLRHAAVVRGDVLLAEALGQMARHALGLAARVDEHQRRAVLAHELARAGRRPASTPRPTSPPRAARPGSRAADRARARGRRR